MNAIRILLVAFGIALLAYVGVLYLAERDLLVIKRYKALCEYEAIHYPAECER